MSEKRLTLTVDCIDEADRRWMSFGVSDVQRINIWIKNARSISESRTQSYLNKASHRERNFMQSLGRNYSAPVKLQLLTDEWHLFLLIVPHRDIRVLWNRKMYPTLGSLLTLLAPFWNSRPQNCTSGIRLWRDNNYISYFEVLNM